MMDLETLDKVTDATIQMLDRLAGMTQEEAKAYFDNFICEWAKNAEYRAVIKAIHMGYHAGHLKAGLQLLSEHVDLLGEPFASCYRKMMEEGQ